MPDPQAPDPLKVLDYKAQAEQKLAGVMDSPYIQAVQKRFTGGLMNGLADIVKMVLKAAAGIGAYLGRVLLTAENRSAPEFAELASVAVQDLFGVQASPAALNPGGGRGGRQQVAVDVGDMLFKAFAGAAATGAGAEIQPSDVPAKAFLSTMTQLSLEGWLEGWVAEFLSFGQMETFGELDDKISHTLGLGRASAAVHGPLVKDLIVTPLQWKLNKEHRPTLLTTSLAAKQIARGRGDREKWLEDIRRQGFSEERIEAILTDQAKFRSVSDAFRLVRAGQWSEGAALKHLRDQGYDDEGAHDELALEQLRAIETFERSMATAAVDAYVNGRIDEGSLGGFISGATISPQEKAQYTELAHARRQLSLKPLSPSEAEACVKAKVLSVVDYRHALERDGRTDEAIFALELLLRWELDKATEIEEHRRQQEAQRAAEKAARDAAAAAKKAEVAAQRALARRGKPADLERAVVLGLIPVSRLEEIYRATFDSDTVGILLAIVGDERAAYLAQQAAREDALRRAAVRDIDIGALEAAVVAGVLTLDEFRARLAQHKLSDEDAGILVDTLAAKLQDTADAKAQHDAAVAAAKIKHVDLSTIETLVRRGHRSMVQYDRTLADLGFDEAARAAMVELLQVHIDDDAHARDVRAAAEARLAAKGLSLEQFRRAVVLTLKTVDQFQTFLVDQGFTPDASIVLVDELRADVAEADAARRRRAAADAKAGHLQAPLADVARAARLGLIPVDVYFGRLTRDGYSADDIAIETDLLVQEMADIAAAKAKAQAAADAARAKGLSLDQLARTVMAGLVPIAKYQAALLEQGYTVDASAVLVQLLQAAVDAHQAALDRAQQIAADQATKDPSFAQLQLGVKDGLLSMDDFAARIASWGYADDDVALLVAELQVQLDAKAPPAAG